jgi:pseudaminic acid cytidylyltransferase
MARSIAIIPARGGSKRIPKKNIKDFFGKPLIAYSIQTALKSELFEKVVVSTDDDKIEKIAKEYGAEVLKRPKELADDFTGTGDVTKHALSVYKGYEFACTIYATAPFLQEKYLKEGLEELIKNKDAVMSFGVTTFDYPIWRSFRITDKNRCEMFWEENFPKRSQDLEEAFHDVGQFYWERVGAKKSDIAFGKESIPIKIPRYLVQDIDTMEDWVRAEMMYKVVTPSSEEEGSA